MRTSGSLLCVAILIFTFTPEAGAQLNTQLPCTVQQPVFSTTAVNIFNDRQEQDLGDALAEWIESDLQIAAPTPDDQLTRIGERLLAVLPPTGIRYRFRAYESGEINGFSVAGGRVYISRKLIAAVKNDDELAGVLAHEIGHLATHQTAIEMTQLFKVRLGITQVGDRADIFAKVHQLFGTPAKGHEPEGNEEKSQLVADRVALYAMIRAGFAPESFASFLNQITENKGKTGNWFTDAFGVTHEASRRYRSALKLIAELPAGCSAQKPLASAAFQSWQRTMVTERIKSAESSANDDRLVKVDHPIRPGLWHIRFSPDARYVLAQDDADITVVDRAAAKVLFQIDAPNVDAAQFTPDSQNVIFTDEKLRIETWNVAAGKRTGVRELVLYESCRQRLLAPDGQTLLCVSLTSTYESLRVGVKLIDVDSGKVFYDKPNFYEPDVYQWGRLSQLVNNINNGYNIVTQAVSPDGRYLVVSASARTLAYDLHSRQPVTLGGKLKGLTQTRMTFVGPNRLYVIGDLKNNGLREARILSFPDGQVISESELGDQQFEAATDGKYLAIWPLKDYNVGLLNIETNKLMVLTKLYSADTCNGFAVAESVTGGVQLDQLGQTNSIRVPLPIGRLPSLRAGLFSPDGKYLAVSMRERSGFWNAETGKQLFLTRPFTSAWMDENDRLYGQFPKFVALDPQELRFTMTPFENKTLSKMEDDEIQYHDLGIRLKPMNKDRPAYKVTLEVKKMETQAVLWKRDFQHERPAIWPAEDNRLVLGWDLSSDAAREEIKSHPELKRESEAMKDRKKGLLIEIVDPESGAPIDQVIVAEADLTNGWDDIRRALVSDKFVLARGEHDNTAIYRIDTGTKVGEFFGRPVATDAKAGLIAAINREDEILLVDEQTGKERKRFTLGSPVRVARIVGDKEKTLLVLTADQVVHRLPIEKWDNSAATSVAAAK